MNDPLGNTASDDRRRGRNGRASAEASDDIFISTGWYGPRMRDILDSYSFDSFSSGWSSSDEFGGGGGSYAQLKNDLANFGDGKGSIGDDPVQKIIGEFSGQIAFENSDGTQSSNPVSGIIQYTAWNSTSIILMNFGELSLYFKSGINGNELIYFGRTEYAERSGIETGYNEKYSGKGWSFFGAVEKGILSNIEKQLGSDLRKKIEEWGNANGTNMGKKFSFQSSSIIARQREVNPKLEVVKFTELYTMKLFKGPMKFNLELGTINSINIRNIGLRIESAQFNIYLGVRRWVNSLHK